MFTAAQRNRIQRAIVPITPGLIPGGPYPSPSNVQGDVYTVFSKAAEDFIFFKISDKARFKQWLKNFKPTTSSDVADNINKVANRVPGTRVTIAQFQIAFSRAGMNFLGETGDVGDFHFDKGPQVLDKRLMDDQGEWDQVFWNADKSINNPLHCVLLIAADSVETRDANRQTKLEELAGIVETPTVVSGKDRPGDFKGHEHFGYKDGISQPALIGLTAGPNTPEIQKRDAGVIVMGYKGDPMLGKRPAWTKDGTLMVFRKLEQSVPEFEKYKRESGKKWREFIPEEYKKNTTLTDEEGAALFGAQIFGRWASGLPLQNFPIRDNKELAKTITKPELNNFDFSVNNDYSAPTDLRCPFFSHIRKTAPRQLEPYVQRKFLDSTSIIRAGIPYGPEATSKELADGKSDDNPRRKRGLLFNCYQSSIANGFMCQTRFGGNDYFPFSSASLQKHGQDPIIGSPPREIDIKDNHEKLLLVKSLDQKEQIVIRPLNFKPDTATDPRQPFFVTSRGGEYFFVPSVSELQRLANL